MKKKRLTALALAILASAALGSCANQAQQQEDPRVESGLILSERGIHIKKLSTGTDSNGKEYVVLGYTTDPVNTTHTRFDVGVSFKESGATGSPTDYVSATIDTANKTVRITKLADFSDVIVVTITDAWDNTKSASVEVHLKQKFLGWPSTHTLDAVTGGQSAVPQSANVYWKALKWSTQSGQSPYQGNGFSQTYTDALTAQEKIPAYSDVTVASATYYVNGTAIGVGSSSSGTGSYGIPYYGSANPGFINKVSVTNGDVYSAASLDFADWTNSQKEAAALADSMTLTVTGTCKLTIEGQTSGAYAFSVSLDIPNQYYQNLVDAYPLSSVSMESPTVTF